MKLSDNFTLEELTVSEIAARQSIDNRPSAAIVENLKRLCIAPGGLEDIRKLLDNKAITITSGYRSSALNRAIGGAGNSAHLVGHAADFICPAAGSAFEVCQKIAGSTLVFDQLIYEWSWVHISLAPTLRRQVMTRSSAGYITGLRYA